MSGKALFKITLSKEKWGLFNRVPLNLPISSKNGKLKPSARELLEKVFAFTRRKGDEISGTRLTYAQVSEETGRVRSTVAAAFEELRDANLIKRLDRDVDGTQYVYTGEATSGQFYLIPQYLHTLEIRIKGTYRRLTSAEVHVLAYLMSECAAPTNGARISDSGKYLHGGVCRTSYKKLSRVLHYAVASVRRAIGALMKARLVTRPNFRKGVNGAHLSGYEVHPGLYVYKRYVKKARTPEEETKIRTNYYADLREQAKERAMKYMGIAERNKAFRANRAQLGKYELSLAKAELYAPDTLPTLRGERLALLEERDAILKGIGLTLRDITLQCCCPVCKDEGRLASGEWCTCYPGGGL